jgi:hypothetical protein
MTQLLHSREGIIQLNSSIKNRRFTLAGVPRFKDTKTERSHIHSRILVYFINILFWSGLLLIVSLIFDSGI